MPFRRERKLPADFRASASIMAMAAGSFGWAGLANSASQNPSSPWILLPETFSALDDGTVIVALETGEQLTLTADQYVILEGGLLLVVDQLAQNSFAELPVLGSFRTQLFTDVQPVRSPDGSIVQAGNQQPLWSGEGPAPRLFEEVDVQRFELAQDQQDQNQGKEALLFGGAGSTLVGLGITVLGMMNSGTSEAEEGTAGNASSGGGAGGAQLNRAPSFTSALTASVAENTGTPFYTVTASDPDGDVCTCAISGGADAAKFELVGDQLQFRTAPDFESYGSANGNNSYEVQITVSDGNGGTDTQLLTINVTDVTEPPEFLSDSGFQALTPATTPTFTGSAGNSFVGYLDASTTNPDPLTLAGAYTGMATFNMVAGGDNFFLAGSSAAFSGGSLNYIGGPGDDTLSFDAYLAYSGSASFDMRAGGDNLFHAGSSAANASGSLNYIGGPGDDTLSFDDYLAYSGSVSFDMRAGGDNTLTVLAAAASETGSLVYLDGAGDDTLTFGEDLAQSGMANFDMSKGGTNTFQAGASAGWYSGTTNSPAILYTGGTGVDDISFGDRLAFRGYVTIDLTAGGNNVLSFGQAAAQRGELVVNLGSGADSLTFGADAAARTSPFHDFARVEIDLGNDSSADTIVFLGAVGTGGGSLVIQNFDHLDGDTIDVNDLSGFTASVTSAGAGTAVQISTNDAEFTLELGSNTAATALDAALGTTGGAIIT